MTIRQRIEELRRRVNGNRWISIHAYDAAYNAHDFGFFLEDAEEFLKQPASHVLDLELTNEYDYTSQGVKCTALTYKPRKG